MADLPKGDGTKQNKPLSSAVVVTAVVSVIAMISFSLFGGSLAGIVCLLV